LLRFSLKDTTVELYDSLEPPPQVPEEILARFTRVVRNVKNYLNAEGCEPRWDVSRDRDAHYLKFSRIKTNKQRNGADCGVFVCAFANALSTGALPSLKPEQANAFRLSMAQVLSAGLIL
jgi:Ulp1 family protease